MQGTVFIKKVFICSYLLMTGIINQAASQEPYEWWNKKHNWDGYTHWSNYIIYSPGYMGPNALPVPRLADGILSARITLEPEATIHIQSGEFVSGGGLRFFYPIAEGIAGLEFSHVMVEYYKTDTLIRDERFARSEQVEGFATGDVNLATYLTLVKNRCWPDMALRINLRTASGSKLSNARFTNSPGYFFDLSFGKNMTKKSEQPKPVIRMYGTLGFYVWQTNLENNRQNDAFLTGLGTRLNFSLHAFSAEAAGYFGYMKMRDDPVVVRFIYELTGKNNGLRFQYQKGVYSIYHHSVSLSWVIFFG
ncbi:MAG: hypothetical protein ACNA7V_06415 [Bacteroidales bacterium]